MPDGSNFMKISHEGGKLFFDTGSVNLKNGKPTIVFADMNSKERDENEFRSALSVCSAKRKAYCGGVKETTYAWRCGKNNLFTWTVGEMLDHNGFTLRANFYNGGDTAVKIDKFILCSTGDNGLACAGDYAEWMLLPLVHTKISGSLADDVPSPNEVQRKKFAYINLTDPPIVDDEMYEDNRWRVYDDYVTLYKDGGKTGLIMGATGTPESDVRFACRIDKSNISFSIICDMSGVEVEPGQWRASQEVAVLAGEYNYAVETILQWTAVTHGCRRARKAADGWCSWYGLYQNISAESVIETVDALADLRGRLPFQVIQIDDGFEKRVGDWDCNERFPDGLRPIVKKINDMGATAGIWLAPLAAHEKTGLIEKHPDWFQRKKDGDFVGQASDWGNTSRWLDPTHPEVLSFIRGIIRKFKADGFRYFKIDYTNIYADCRFYDERKTRLQAMRGLYALYREELGEECHLLACFGFTRGVFGYADSCRIGPDACPEYDTPHTCTLANAIHAVGYNAIANGILFNNDPDVFYPTPKKKLTADEARTWRSFVGLLGGTAMISEPMRDENSRDSLRLMEIMLPPSSIKGRPLNGGVDNLPRRFGFVTQKPWGTALSVLLWNIEDRVGKMAIGQNSCYSADKKFHIWSFWDEKYLGIGDVNAVIGDIAPHGCSLLRLTQLGENENAVAFIGSNLHITAGSEELKDFLAAESGVTIRLSAAGARDGCVYLFSRKPLTLKSFNGCAQAKVESAGGDVWKVCIVGRYAGAEQSFVLAADL